MTLRLVRHGYQQQQTGGGGQRLELWLLKSREIRGAGALPTRKFLLASETF